MDLKEIEQVSEAFKKIKKEYKSVNFKFPNGIITIKDFVNQIQNKYLKLYQLKIKHKKEQILILKDIKEKSKILKNEIKRVKKEGLK